MNRHVKRPLETLGTRSRLTRLCLTLGSRLEFRQTYWTRMKCRSQIMTVGVMVEVGSLLGLELFTLHNLGVVSKVRRNASIDMILARIVVLDQPRCPIPCVAGDSLLDERSEHCLGEDTPVATDVLIGYNRVL